jgi:hypothetical protein
MSYLATFSNKLVEAMAKYVFRVRDGDDLVPDVDNEGEEFSTFEAMRDEALRSAHSEAALSGKRRA